MSDAGKGYSITKRQIWAHSGMAASFTCYAGWQKPRSLASESMRFLVRGSPTATNQFPALLKATLKE